MSKHGFYKSNIIPRGKITKRREGMSEKGLILILDKLNFIIINNGIMSF